MVFLPAPGTLLLASMPLHYLLTPLIRHFLTPLWPALSLLLLLAPDGAHMYPSKMSKRGRRTQCTMEEMIQSLCLSDTQSIESAQLSASGYVT
mmetsp:Transcript_25384/g.55460  ORF Transcript_25384/g.55460 Transcript_25384/m.55460 type:complete len:93 (-) Transcript_25384:1297-1575(-)